MEYQGVFVGDAGLPELVTAISCCTTSPCDVDCGEDCTCPDDPADPEYR